MVGDRTSVERLQEREWRLCVEDLNLADVFQGEPNLRTVGCCGNVRAERARLPNLPDNLVIGDGDDGSLRSERRADIAVFPIRREDRHARTVCNDDPCLFFVGRTVEHSDVVLAPDDDPDLLAVRGKERFVRRAPDVSDVLDRVGRGVDEVHGIRADRDHRDGSMIRREPKAMHQQLTAVKRTEIGRQRIAEPNNAEQFVVERDR